MNNKKLLFAISLFSLLVSGCNTGGGSNKNRSKKTDSSSTHVTSSITNQTSSEESHKTKTYTDSSSDSTAVTGGVIILPSENGYIAVDKATAVVGEFVTFTFFPNESYRVKSFMVGSEDYSEFVADNQCLVAMVEGGLVVRGEFELYHTVTFDYPDGQQDVVVYVTDGGAVHPATPPVVTEDADFIEWDFDFNRPITDNITISPIIRYRATIYDLMCEYKESLLDPTHKNKYLDYYVTVKGTVVWYRENSATIYLQDFCGGNYYGLNCYCAGGGSIPEGFKVQNTYIEITGKLAMYQGAIEITYPQFEQAHWNSAVIIETPDVNVNHRIEKLIQNYEVVNSAFSDVDLLTTYCLTSFSNYVGCNSTLTFESASADNMGLYYFITVAGLDHIRVQIIRGFEDNEGNVLNKKDLVEGKTYQVSGVMNYSGVYNTWTIIPTASEDLVVVH